MKRLMKDTLEGPTVDLNEFFNAFEDVLFRERSKVLNFLKRTNSKFNDNLQADSKLPAEVRQKDFMKWTIRLRNLGKFRKTNYDALFNIIKKVSKMVKKVYEEWPIDKIIPWVKVENRLECIDKYLAEVSATCQATRFQFIEIHNGFRGQIEKIFSQPVEVNFDSEAAVEQFQEAEIEDEIPVLKELLLESLPPGKITKVKVAIQQDATGEWVVVHVIVAKGKFDGPVLGLTSALHGNELNGIPLIFRLLREVDVDTMKGTLVAIPVCNPPGYLRKQRGFSDNQDLNRLFPGKKDGNCGQSYVYHFLHKVITKFNYHIDLHTASTGRVNSLYVRADMNNPICNQMAILQKPQIIVHNTAPDGSLRSAAMDLGIPSITLEIGDPLAFHKTYVATALNGVENVIKWLHLDDVLDAGSSTLDKPRISRTDSLFNVDDIGEKPVTTICSRSRWMYSQHGGVLRVLPDVNTWVYKDDVVARVQNLFGDIVHTYRAAADGIIVGKSSNPICVS